MRLIDFFLKTVAVHPTNICLQDGDRSLSYAEVDAQSKRVARGLRIDGLQPGDRVAVLSANRIEAFIAVFALMRADAVWVSLNARTPTSGLIEQITLAEVNVLFYDSSFADSVPRFSSECPRLRRCIELSDNGGQDTLAKTLETDHMPIPEAPYSMTDVSRISFTGGTSGSPKAVMIPHSAQVAFTDALINVLRPRAQDRYLLIAPMSHAAGSATFAYFAVGAQIDIFSKTEPAAILDAMVARDTSALFLPPTLIYLLLDALEETPRRFPALRYLAYGAAPMEPAQIERAMRLFGRVLMQIYAQSETPMAISYMQPADHSAAIETSGKSHRLASAGRIHHSTRVRIVTADGQDAPPDEPGEIWVKGAINMLGYFNDAEATSEAMEDGWVKTGDVGRIDADGYLYIVDRLKDMIITGGFNVYPSQVEAVLRDHAAIRDCAVIGLPDPKWGECVTAVVVPESGSMPDEEELHSFCRARLGGVMTPKRFLLRSSLPRSPLGKVLKRALKEALLNAPSD